MNVWIDAIALSNRILFKYSRLESATSYTMAVGCRGVNQILTVYMDMEGRLKTMYTVVRNNRAQYSTSTLYLRISETWREAVEE